MKPLIFIGIIALLSVVAFGNVANNEEEDSSEIKPEPIWDKSFDVASWLVEQEDEAESSEEMTTTEPEVDDAVTVTVTVPGRHVPRRQRGRHGRQRGRGRWARVRHRSKPFCPLMEELAEVEDPQAFVRGCWDEMKNIKASIKSSVGRRRGRGRGNRQRPACVHPCCDLEQGQKCCPIVGQGGNCAFVVKDAVYATNASLAGPPHGRRHGRGHGQHGRGHGQHGRGHGQYGGGQQGQGHGRRHGGGQGAGHGRHGGNRRRQGTTETGSCQTDQPKGWQKIRRCGNVTGIPTRFLLMKGLPTILNETLTCRFDSDCEEGQSCCSEDVNAGGLCDRKCI